jgi:hypothetical protein
LHLIIVVELFPSEMFLWVKKQVEIAGRHKQQQLVCEFPLDIHLLRWEIVWRNAPRIWRDFGSALTLQTRLTQTKTVLPLSNEHGSQVKDQGRQHCCHNRLKNFPIDLHVMYLYFPDTPRIFSFHFLINIWRISHILYYNFHTHTHARTHARARAQHTHTQTLSPS